MPVLCILSVSCVLSVQVEFQGYEDESVQITDSSQMLRDVRNVNNQVFPQFSAVESMCKTMIQPSYPRSDQKQDVTPNLDPDKPLLGLERKPGKKERNLTWLEIC